MPAFSQRTILSHASSAGNPITVSSVVINATDAVVWLSLKVNGATNRAGGLPTLGPYTFKASSPGVQKAAVSPEASVETFYLLNPLPGSYTLTIPNTGALTIFSGLDAGVVPAGCFADWDASVGANNTAANPSPGALTRSRAGANSNITFAIAGGGWTTWNPSAQAGTVINNTDDGATGTGRQYAIGGPGSFTCNWTFGTSDDWGCIADSFKIVDAVEFPNYKNRFTGGNMVSGAG